MAKYNINQIQKMIDRLAEIGIKTEKAILDMKFEDCVGMINENSKRVLVESGFNYFN